MILKLINPFTNSHVEALVCLFLWTLCAHVCIHYVRVSPHASPRRTASKQFVRLQCECSHHHHHHHHPPTAVVVVAGKSKARACFPAPPAKVSICEEHFRDNVDELREAVQHELTHAYDVWLPRSNWPPLSSADRGHCLLFGAPVCVCGGYSTWWISLTCVPVKGWHAGESLCAAVQSSACHN